jgi:HTH-type transcriptional regulator/antitoxin HigA
MKNPIIEDAIKHWSHVAPLVSYPKNEKEFDKLTSQLDELLDIIGDNEKHSLMGLVDILSNLISTYEDHHHQRKMGKGINALEYLMESHQLSQVDFPEIASQGVMSEILNGKRALNLRQIRLLAKRFKVTPATFIDD